WADLAVPIIKTVKLAPATTIEGLPEYKLGERMNALWWRKVASAILFDSDARWSEDGDTREPIEWRSIRMMGATAPNEGRVHLVLSGGLTPDNVASHAALLRRATDRALRRRTDLAQARGSLSHRRPQGQQRARPGAARRAHEEDAHHRRDRRGPAWRGHRHRRRAARRAVRGLHGRGGHRAPGAQRLPHATARRQGHSRRVGQQDAQGRGERGAARLGHERAQHVLPARP